MNANPINADPTEIEKFGRLADIWWDKQGELKSLHDINPLRLAYIEETAGGLAGKAVLDVGCGGGILSESMAVAGASVLGIDMAEQSLAVAKQHAQDGGVDNVSYRCISVEDLAAEAAGSFDVVSCMEMLEHVPDPQSVVRACAKLVKPNGVLVFSTINRNPKSYLHAVLAAEYILGLVAKGTHDWQRFIKPAELARMCRAAGLTVADTKGLGYNPLLRKYFLQDNVSVNYMIACR
ncbi:MAG: bifunctional 2-polyprenyl-6-hydroxyphenol methylase/3-demethylubiquinol 3-O-methyltransferase UbiG [Conchiformibius sp.]|nr:bifunctional 2-polyprenyl-6-hydroxyphenol methylase/3-demethylubiquinol 3-O-methyltransferase UbiG [Conchiformibius sp.]